MYKNFILLQNHAEFPNFNLVWILFLWHNWNPKILRDKDMSCGIKVSESTNVYGTSNSQGMTLSTLKFKSTMAKRVILFMALILTTTWDWFFSASLKSNQKVPLLKWHDWSRNIGNPLPSIAMTMRYNQLWSHVFDFKHSSSQNIGLLHDLLVPQSLSVLRSESDLKFKCRNLFLEQSTWFV